MHRTTTHNDYDCKDKVQTTKYTYEVTFDPWPESVTVNKGDRLRFYAEISSSKDTKVAVQLKLVWRSLTSVQRGTENLWGRKSD